MKKLTGETILGLLEATARNLPVEGLEVYTMTDGLAVPKFNGEEINAIGLNKEHGRHGAEFSYFGCYYDGESDEDKALKLTPEQAARLLWEAARYYLKENPPSD